MIIHRFLSWIEAAPATQRAEAATALARSFLMSQLTPEDHEIADAALTLLLDDPNADVRMELAKVLAPSEKSPPHLIMALVEDRADISSQILSQSPLLMDAELIEWVCLGIEKQQCAIAKRQNVSSAVAGAICQNGGVEACVELLQNQTATYSEQDLILLADRLGMNGTVRTLLLDFKKLPVQARHILIDYHCTQLSNWVVDKGWLELKTMERVALEASEKATVILASDVQHSDIPTLINHLLTRNQLTPAFLLRALCAGNIELFEMTMAHMVNIDTKRMRSIIRSGNVSAFSAAYRKSSLPESAFDVFTAALSVTCQWEDAPLSHEVKQLPRRIMDEILLRCQGDISTKTLDRSLKLLRRLAADSARDSARDFALQVAKAA